MLTNSRPSISSARVHINYHWNRNLPVIGHVLRFNKTQLTRNATKFEYKLRFCQSMKMSRLVNFAHLSTDHGVCVYYVPIASSVSSAIHFCNGCSLTSVFSAAMEIFGCMQIIVNGEKWRTAVRVAHKRFAKCSKFSNTIANDLRFLLLCLLLTRIPELCAVLLNCCFQFVELWNECEKEKICIRLVFPINGSSGSHFHNLAINSNQHSP